MIVSRIKKIEFSYKSTIVHLSRVHLSYLHVLIVSATAILTSIHILTTLYFVCFQIIDQMREVSRSHSEETKLLSEELGDTVKVREKVEYMHRFTMLSKGGGVSGEVFLFNHSSLRLTFFFFYR